MSLRRRLAACRMWRARTVQRWASIACRVLCRTVRDNESGDWCLFERSKWVGGEKETIRLAPSLHSLPSFLPPVVLSHTLLSPSSPLFPLHWFLVTPWLGCSIKRCAQPSKRPCSRHLGLLGLSVVKEPQRTEQKNHHYYFCHRRETADVRGCRLRSAHTTAAAQRV